MCAIFVNVILSTANIRLCCKGGLWLSVCWLESEIEVFKNLCIIVSNFVIMLGVHLAFDEE